MTYVEHKHRLFSTVTERPSLDNIIVPRKRSESRLKSYCSNTDVRSWSLEEDERRKYMLSLMNPPTPEKIEWKYVPFCAVVGQLFSFHDRQVCNLENMINELTCVLRNALPQLGDAAMKETQQMLDDFSTKYNACLRYFKEPLDIAALLCGSEGSRSVYTDTEYSETSTGGFLNRTIEEDIKTSDAKEVYDDWNKISEETLSSSEPVEDVFECKTVARLEASPEEKLLKETEEKLKQLQEESKGDKDKISKLEQLLCAANCKIKSLASEKRALKFKLSQHENSCSGYSSEEEALKKIYITENRRMREELEGLEQMCWRIKHVLQLVMKERDCYRRRCVKLEHLANEIEDLKCEMEAWRFTEQERCRLEKVVHHLKHVLEEQDHQLKHLLCHIEVLSQRDGEYRSQSCDDLKCPSEESLSDSSPKNMLCLPSISKGVLDDDDYAAQVSLNTCSRRKLRQRPRNSTIHNLFSQRPRPRNFMITNYN